MIKEEFRVVLFYFSISDIAEINAYLKVGDGGILRNYSQICLKLYTDIWIENRKQNLSPFLTMVIRLSYVYTVEASYCWVKDYI